MELLVAAAVGVHELGHQKETPTTGSGLWMTISVHAAGPSDSFPGVVGVPGRGHLRDCS